MIMFHMTGNALYAQAIDMAMASAWVPSIGYNYRKGNNSLVYFTYMILKGGA